MVFCVWLVLRVVLRAFLFSYSYLHLFFFPLLPPFLKSTKLRLIAFSQLPELYFCFHCVRMARRKNTRNTCIRDTSSEYLYLLASSPCPPLLLYFPFSAFIILISLHFVNTFLYFLQIFFNMNHYVGLLRTYFSNKNLKNYKK